MGELLIVLSSLNVRSTAGKALKEYADTLMSRFPGDCRESYGPR